MFNFVIAAQREADRQSQILKIMTVFPQRYNSNPTYEQFERFITTLDFAQLEYQCLEALYVLFAQDKIPTDIDAKIRSAARSWRPSGQIVESRFETKLLQQEDKQ